MNPVYASLLSCARPLDEKRGEEKKRKKGDDSASMILPIRSMRAGGEGEKGEKTCYYEYLFAYLMRP